MIDTLGIAVLSFFLQLFPHSSSQPVTMPLLAWENQQIFALPTENDPVVEEIVNDYLQNLSQQGLNLDLQGVWIETEWAELENHRADIPLSGASLTKIATTLAVLETWGTDHRFETRIYGTGPVENGVLKGDLIIEGGGDPLFVWEEAIALGNALNEMGIRKIEGNLIISGDFSMNFQEDSQVSGELLKRGLNADLWSNITEKQYQELPQGTKRPKVEIRGTVQVINSLPEGSNLLLNHQSLTTVELLKQMNIYSNNIISERLAQSLGGAEKVREIAIKTAQVSPSEIHLINGSGLGVENSLSPRAVTQMLRTIESKYADKSISVADLFPVAGRDKKGTMKWRHIPEGVAIKTGTLAQVSALAGVIPTKERGLVWFSIQNSGSSNIEKFRAQQDQLLQSLAKHWQLTPMSTIKKTPEIVLGDPARNVKLN